MNEWSILTHDDLPPAPGQRPSPPAGQFPDGTVPGAPPIAPIEAERIARQHDIAHVVRSAAAQVADRQRRRMLFDRALLVEFAESADDVVVLLAELRALGVNVRRAP
jgi:hypothetical protein